MPRRRDWPRLPPGDRDHRLAEEVLYLHSLWRRGPPAPARATAPIQSPSAYRKITKRKRRRLERAAAAEPEDTGSEWPLPPSQPPSSSPRTWPEAASASSPSPAHPPPPSPPPSPGPLAQRYALRAAVEFFSSRAASDDEDGDGSESEGEQDAAGFFTGMFERDAALRGHYERRWEERQFPCMVCAAGTRKAGRRFAGCAALVQHARLATRYGRPRAHRALAAVVCRVLGWDTERLPSIVIDPRGTLGQALASGARTDVQAAKENAETWMEGPKAKSTDGVKEAMELDGSEKIAEKVTSNKEDDCLIQGNNGEAHEQEIAKESAQQEGNIGEDKEEHADKSN